MKELFIRDLIDYVGEEISELFYVRDLVKNHNRQGTKYTLVTIVDKSGEGIAKIWSEFDVKFEQCKNHVCVVTGKVDLYNGVPSIAISKLDIIEEYDFSDFAISLEEERKKEALRMLDDLISKISDTRLQRLVSSIFTERNRRFLCELPASMGNHHAFNGGQLIHMLEVARMALSAAKVHESYAVDKGYAYTAIKFDLLIAGSLLHDIGKITQYKPFPVATRTARGHLVGYAESVAFIVSYNMKLSADERVQDLSELLHIVEASHGEDGGMRPCTLESILVYNAVRMSSQLDNYHCTLYNDDLKHMGVSRGAFVYSRMLETSVYRKEKKDGTDNK